MSSRPLAERELALLSWCVQLLPAADRVALQAQLATCRVIDEDEGGLWFEVSAESPPISSEAIDLVYCDHDEGPAEFIIAFVAGYLSWVDRFRSDIAVLQNRVPMPSEIRSFRVSPD